MLRAFGVAVILAAILPASASAAFPGHNGKIAFGSTLETCKNGCDHTLFTIDPDGSDLTSLQTPRADYPAWSPDGQRIAFTFQPTGVADIYVRVADGALTQLTTGAFDLQPAWSPDGSKIAFTRFVPAEPFGAFEIFVMNFDGSGATRLTHTRADGVGLDSTEPAWSPDGQRIAFTRTIGSGLGDTDDEIYVMNADGTGLFRVTRNFTPNNRIADQSDSVPDWSPDGKWIAFSGRYDDNSDIYAIRPDGTGLTRLTTDENLDRAPAWSPDGRRIAYLNAFSDLVVMNADGSDAATLLPFGDDESNPSWQALPNRPPDCSGVRATPARLWPPNHKLVPISLAGATDPDGDSVVLTITSITSDETGGDFVLGPASNEARLRAERDPGGDGRVYSIAYEVTDAIGAGCTGTATVSVPHNL